MMNRFDNINDLTSQNNEADDLQTAACAHACKAIDALVTAGNAEETANTENALSTIDETLRKKLASLGAEDFTALQHMLKLLDPHIKLEGAKRAAKKEITRK